MFTRTLTVLGSLLLTGLLLVDSTAEAARTRQKLRLTLSTEITSGVIITAPSPASGTVSIRAEIGTRLYKFLTISLDGTEIARCQTSTCVASWNTRLGPNGTHSLTANNIDPRKRVRESASVSVIVDNDLTPPYVTLTAPASATGSVTLSASANDAGGISALTILVDGTPLQATSMVTASAVTSTTSSTSATWDATTATPGSHTVQAFATDASGNAGSSVPATVVVTTTAPPTVSDDGIYPKLTTPSLPPAGGTFTDPTFGTTILRVTDPSTAPYGAGVNSAAQDSMFNANGTLFYLGHSNGGGAHLYAANKAAQQVTYKGVLPNTGAPTYYNLSYDGARWDPTNPQVLYAIVPSPTKRELWQLTFGASPNYLPATLVKLHDFSQEIPTGGYPYSRVQISPDSRYFAITASTTAGQDTYDYVVVWDQQTGQTWTLHTPDRISAPAGLHSMVLDNTGHYAIIETGDYHRSYIWHWPTDTLSAALTSSSPSCFGGHKVLGAGEIITPGCTSGTWTLRPLDTPLSIDTIFAWPTKNGHGDNFEDSHSSRLLQDGSFIQSRYVSMFMWSGLFTNHSGSIYKIVGYRASGAPRDEVPEIVRYQGQPLTQVAGLPTASNQWFYDAAADTLYFWLPDSSNPKDTLITNALQIFDWRPLMEEIVKVHRTATGDWTWTRLAHHRSQYSGAWNTIPRGNADPTGSFVLFESNWDRTLVNADGSPRSDVFLILVDTPL